nr:alpha/beta fold hydrolase [uncultured Shimia sp.]
MAFRVFVFIIAFGVAACADRSIAPVLPEAMASDNLAEVFIATNRGTNAAGYFDETRSDKLSFVHSWVSMPPDRVAGDPPLFKPKPNLKKHFALASQDTYPSGNAFLADIRKRLAQLPPENREVTLYVHGFYNGYADTVFRMAQMYTDFGAQGIPMVFAWPSAGTPTGYTYDRDSALHARDELEELLYMLPQTGARNILVVGHSMGGMLLMETLRQIEIARPGWAAANISSTLLMSPDISIDVFREQAKRAGTLPQPFIVVTSKEDKVLKLSSLVNKETDRLGLGNSIDELTEFPITFVDITKFSNTSDNPHFVLAESPALISMMAAVRQMPNFAHADAQSTLGSLASSSLQVQNATEYELTPDLPRN